jgi:hypothetical protein
LTAHLSTTGGAPTGGRNRRQKDAQWEPHHRPHVVGLHTAAAVTQRLQGEPRGVAEPQGTPEKTKHPIAVRTPSHVRPHLPIPNQAPTHDSPNATGATAKLNTTATGVAIDNSTATTAIDAAAPRAGSSTLSVPLARAIR